jgi:cytochrome c oxidase subunit I
MSSHDHSQTHVDHHHDDHHSEESFISKYLFSMDHKMIARQFLVTAIFMALAAMIMSTLFRLQLAWPNEGFAITNWILGDKWAPGGIMTPEIYLGLVTIHGTILVFFVLTGGLSGTFANLLIPYQIGARDMASPLMNMLSYWFFLIGAIIMLASMYLPTGPASPGWTIYPPLSALPEAMPGSGMGMTMWLISMSLFIVSALLAGLNYVITVLNLRAVGMTMLRLPLTIWALLVTAIIGVLSFPVLLAAVLLLIFDRTIGTSFYLSDIYINGHPLENIGGSPILFQHLFWFLGHPEVYIIILPALGIMSEVISVNSRKPIFGYKAMIGSMLIIALLSFVVWGHHMFVTGMNPFLGSVFVFTTVLIAIPSAVKAFNYITTLWKGTIRFTPAMLFCIGAVSTFVTGGVTGIILADAALDINLHDSYFVVAHFHIVMGLSGGVYHWFPKMYLRMMNKKLGYAHFWLTFISAYGVFFPQHFLGLAGVPRRYYTNSAFPLFENLVSIEEMSTWFAILGAASQFIFFFNFFYSIFRGDKAPKNPLEWTTEVGHHHGNWGEKLPVVHRWAYDYSKPGAKEDFILQTVPLAPGEKDGGEGYH